MKWDSTEIVIIKRNKLIMQVQSRNILFVIAKIAAVLISLLYIGYHIESRAELIHDSERLLNSLTTGNSRYWIAVSLILMLVNYSLETQKWRLLASSIESISFLKAIRSVFTGTTISFFTPNRVGEFAGRILHLGEGHRIRGALAAFVGSSAQLLVTIQAGFIALLFYTPTILQLNQITIILLQIAIVVSVVFLMIGWFRVPKLSLLFEKIEWLKKYNNFGEVFSHFHKRELAITYLYSLLRYLVFCSQQYLLFKAFLIDIDYVTCLKLSAISFLVITLVPSIALGELGVRGGINLVVFATVTNDSAAILISTFSLWCINLALPALLGAFSLLYIRFGKVE